MNVFQGSFTLQNALDVGTISPYCEITGNLLMTVSGLPSVSLPALQKVDGYISVYGDLTTLDLPVLTSVGSFYSEAQQIGTVHLPSLTHADALKVVISDVSLPVLQTVTADLAFANAGAVDVSKLESVGGNLVLCGAKVAAPFSAHQLTTIGQLLIVSGGNQVTSLDLPALTSIGQNAGPNTISLDLGGSSPCGVSGNPQLAQLNLPLLANLGPSNAGSFVVANDPLLPQCRIDALITQLKQHGWNGKSGVIGPTAAGPCP